MNKVAKKERKLTEGDMDDEEKQKVFEIMFKLDYTSVDPNFDRIHSATGSAASDATLIKGNGRKYTIQQKRNRVAATKFFMRNVLGLFVIPTLTVLLFMVYIIVALSSCIL